MHWTRVVGCQEVVIAYSRSYRPWRWSATARLELTLQFAGHPSPDDRRRDSVACDACYTGYERTALRVLSSSAGLRRNHDDSSNSSSISCVGTDAVCRSGGE